MRLARGARRRRRGKGAGDRHAPDLWRQILATLSVIQHAVAEKPLALAQQALEDDLQLLVWERRTRPNPRLRLDQAITAARRPLGFIAIRRVCSDWPGNTLPPRASSPRSPTLARPPGRVLARREWMALCRSVEFVNGGSLRRRTGSSGFPRPLCPQGVCFVAMTGHTRVRRNRRPISSLTRHYSPPTGAASRPLLGA